MAGNTFKRMEKKMTVSTEMIPALQACMEEYMTPDPFNVDGKPYMICNLYFDDDADEVIRTSVSLPWYKEKLRLRSYGVPDADTKVFLELKKKCAGRRHQAPRQDSLPGCTRLPGDRTASGETDIHRRAGTAGDRLLPRPQHSLSENIRQLRAECLFRAGRPELPRDL